MRAAWRVAAAAVLGLAAGVPAGLALRPGFVAVPPVATVAPPGRGLEPAWWEEVTEVADDRTASEPRGLVVTTYRVPADVLFAVDSAVVDERGRRALQDVAGELAGATAVVVAGATDSTGSRAHNEELSLDRAAAARDVLVASGVPAEVIELAAWADDHPVADERGPDPAQARALNRRIEIVVTRPAWPPGRDRPGQSSPPARALGRRRAGPHVRVAVPLTPGP
jgi:outer membrane protein OmpA-like peptidoglycan-associated protein